jgi:mRNA degradation ribonuclease J1/J2
MAMKLYFLIITNDFPKGFQILCWNSNFAKEIEDVLEQFLVNTKPNHLENPRAMENDIRQVVRKHIYRRQKKYPFIVPNVFVM